MFTYTTCIQWCAKLKWVNHPVIQRMENETAKPITGKLMNSISNGSHNNLIHNATTHNTFRHFNSLIKFHKLQIRSAYERIIKMNMTLGHENITLSDYMHGTWIQSHTYRFCVLSLSYRLLSSFLLHFISFERALLKVVTC